jgi:hypothetical protein
MLNLEKIWKSARIEADWLRYYGHSESRMSEKFEDVNFYDRIISIGYAKKNISLPQRCSMLNVTSDKPVLDSDIIELKEEYSLRNHNNNVYTALEYLIGKNIGTEQLIKIIKGEN